MRGRKRKAGAARLPSGRLSRAQMEARAALAQATPEMIARRADVVGIDHVRDQRAGTPLGQLLLIRDGITQRQYDAGCQLEALWRRWNQAAGVPARVACMRSDEDRQAPPVPWEALTLDEQHRQADRWDRAAERMQEVRGAIMRGMDGWLLSWAMLDGLLMDQIMPPRIGALVERLRQTLDIVAKVFRIPEQERAA